MLGYARKINHIKKILYREKAKKNNKTRCHIQHVTYNDQHKETVTLSYRRGTLTQVIEYAERERDLLLLSDHVETRKKGTSHFLPPRKGSHLSVPSAENGPAWVGPTPDGAPRQGNGHREQAHRDGGGGNNHNVDISSYEPLSSTSPEDSLRVGSPISPHMSKHNITVIKEYQDEQEKKRNGRNGRYEGSEGSERSQESQQGKQNKLVLHYHLGSIKGVLTILDKCQAYNYKNGNLLEDICQVVPSLNLREISIKDLLTILHALIKLNYFNEGYFNYMFLCLLNEHSLSNSDLISILFVLSNVHNLTPLSCVLLYRVNFMLLHRMHSLSLHQLHNVLNGYLKMCRRVSARTEFERASKHQLTTEDGRGCPKINSEAFELFYKLRFDGAAQPGEKPAKRSSPRNCVHLIFRLIESLRKKKIPMGKLSKFVTPQDCLNKAFITHLKKEIGLLFVKKLKCENVLFNRLERKRLYALRDSILASPKERGLNGEESAPQKGNPQWHSRREEKSQMGIQLRERELNSAPISSQKRRADTGSACIKLKLIKRMKRQLDARLLVPLIRVCEIRNGNRHARDNKDEERLSSDLRSGHLECAPPKRNPPLDFLLHCYKHLSLKFDAKSLVVTLSCFSQRRQAQTDEVLHMLINLMEKKINKFTPEQIVDLMNSISNLRDERIPNGTLNFLIRFLFNKNGIIYLKDAHMSTLLNVIQKKKKFINEDAVHYISHFVVNHKPPFKNMKNMFSYFSFHFHFNKFGDQFLSALYCSFLSGSSGGNLLELDHLNRVLSSTLVIPTRWKYQKRVFKKIDTCLLSILSRMNRSDYFPRRRDLSDLVQLISHMNNSMTREVYKAYEGEINQMRRKKHSPRDEITNWVCGRTNGANGQVGEGNSTKIATQKNGKKKKKLQFYYAHNSYNEVYLMTSSFNLKIFILIKKILQKMLNGKGCANLHNEEIALLIKTVTNLYEMERKITKMNKTYTYFYVATKWRCKKNKTLNTYFLKIINQINRDILQFLCKMDQERIFLCNVHMLRSNYLFEPLMKEQLLLSHLQQSVCRMGNKPVSTGSAVLFFNFLSSYKIDEMVLSSRGVHLKDVLHNPSVTRAGFEELERTILKAFLASQKMESPNRKREKLFELMYSEKKRQKSRIKNAIKHFFLTYKFTNWEYLKKYQQEKKIYINKISNNLERKMLKRKIKKMDDLVKQNSSFKHMNKYNKFLICKFASKWKKKKKYLILKSTINSSYVDANDIIELLFSSVVMSIRHLVNHPKGSFPRAREHPTCEPPMSEYPKCVTFLLKKMIVLKKPKIVNITYPLYFRLRLCIEAIKWVYPRLMKNYGHILMYWKKVIGGHLGGEKTFKNYFDYAQSGGMNGISSSSGNHMLSACHMLANGSDCSSALHVVTPLNGQTKQSLTKDTNDALQKFLTYPCISQTNYRYKLKSKKTYSLENSLHFKNSKYYKNVVFHDMYEHVSYLQNSSHQLYINFLHLKRRLLRRSNQGGQRRKNKKKKKKNYKSVKQLNCNCAKRNSILFKCSFNIVNVKKVEMFHSHLVRVDVAKRNGTGNIRTFFVFPYAPFNLNTVVKNGTSEDNVLQLSASTFCKRELFLTLFLMKVELAKHIQTELNIVPVATDKLNSIRSRKELHLYLSAKLFC
ncbi:hypothetical protein C922_00794 [Plasmodium inui San Antonio 1]|uniref:Uncharacterized protein n=1 Tax=Plasmodium inui San Antonio 1 TaxID=1237626 RepID=W7A7G4_9APIC|nr:hypothetical protein C922_00794 [Plasmodium inui San Antonio 1]EUD69102.1 hypothetical protein C922_00794 [Plasmodium inui San Antonio 1]